MDEPDHERLAADDAAILELESERILGHTLKLVVLEPGRPLGAAELRGLVSARLDRWPRAGQRVEETRSGPVWAETEVDLDAQIGERPAPGDDERALWRAAGELMATRLDHERPLWALDVIGPIGDGRQAVVARIHHAMADGMTCVRVLDALLWDEVDGPRPSTHDAHHATPPHRGAAGELMHIPGALWRELCAHAARTPFASEIGTGRELAFVGAPLEELKAIGHSVAEHVTVNDVLLATVACGGQPAAQAAAGERLRGMRAQVPVSLHHRDEHDADAGNRDSFLNVDLPVAEADPVRRLLSVNAETARRKRLGDAAELYDFFHALSVAGPLGRAAERLVSGPGEFTLSVSNVPGPRGSIAVAGRRVGSLGTIAEPADRHALRVSALSCAGELRIGFCTDPAAVPGVESLAEATEAALGELRGAALG